MYFFSYYRALPNFISNKVQSFLGDFSAMSLVQMVTFQCTTVQRSEVLVYRIDLTRDVHEDYVRVWYDWFLIWFGSRLVEFGWCFAKG